MISFSDFKRLFDLLDSYEIRHFKKLMVLTILMACLDAAGVASLLPFVAILANPSIVEQNTIVESLFEFVKIFGVSTQDQFLLILGGILLVVLLTSLGLKSFTLYKHTRFAVLVEFSLSKRLLISYLNQSYESILTRNSSELEKIILSEVSIVIRNGLLPVLLGFAHCAVLIALLVLLVMINPLVTGFCLLVFGVFYIIVFALLSGKLRRLGRQRERTNGERYKVISEIFGGLKDIKISGIESYSIARFEGPGMGFADSQSKAIAIAQLPRYLLEALAFGGVLCVVLFSLSLEYPLVDLAPLIAVYAFAGYKILPAMQQVYRSVSDVRFVSPALSIISADLASFNEMFFEPVVLKKWRMEREIEFKDVSYQYPGSDRFALKDINLQVSAGDYIGIVGPTGSGKSTLLDLLVGILEPTKGVIRIDKQILVRSNSGSWRDCIGYVPQESYLCDDTIIANIAFGVSSDDIDFKAVQLAAKLASLHEFIEKELPLQYQTCVGDRGVRLSGGQRQRIAIARALYKSPSILIFDEATSALDNITEREVASAISTLRRRFTVIQVAHRLTTVKNCDRIVVVDRAQIMAEGTYEALKESDHLFNDLVG